MTLPMDWASLAQPVKVALAGLCLPKNSSGEGHSEHGGFLASGDGWGLSVSWALTREVGREGVQILNWQ